MTSNDPTVEHSIKPNRWFRTFMEFAFFIGLFAAASIYLNRNMLSTDTKAPTLTLPQLVASGTPAIQNIHWQAADKTLLYFFAPWCGVCRFSMPGLSMIDAQNVQVIAVALDWRNTEEVSQFVNDVGYQGQVLLGTATTRSEYQIDAYPSYYVVDNQGNILHKDRGISTPPGLWFRLNTL